jgi:hypothetical protein
LTSSSGSAKISAVSSLRQTFALRPLDIKHVFDFPIRLLRSGFAPMFLSTAMVQLPLALLTMPLMMQLMGLAYEMQAMSNEGNSKFFSGSFWEDKLDLAVFAFIMLFVALAYQVLVTPLGNLICARLAVCRLLGRECSFSEAWAYARRRYWPTQVAIALFLLPLLLLSLAVLAFVLLAQLSGDDNGILAAAGGGVLLITLGSCATAFFFCTYFPALNGIVQASEEPEGSGVLAQGLWCLRRAQGLTSGHFWRMLGYLMMLAVIINYITRGLTESLQWLLALVSALASGHADKFVTNLATGMPSTWEMGLILVAASIFGLLFPPYWQCFKTLLYYDLRCRKEAFDLEHQLGLPGGEIAQ